jgi:hypothetical protein
MIETIKSGIKKSCSKNVTLGGSTGGSTSAGENLVGWLESTGALSEGVSAMNISEIIENGVVKHPL